MLIWSWWEASEIPLIIYSADFLHFSSEQIIPFWQIRGENSEHKSTQSLVKYELCVVLRSPSPAPKTNSSFQSPAGEKKRGQWRVNTAAHTLNMAALCVFRKDTDIIMTEVCLEKPKEEESSQGLLKHVLAHPLFTHVGINDLFI